jgi:hypothetical protein
MELFRAHAVLLDMFHVRMFIAMVKVFFPTLSGVSSWIVLR